MNTLHHFKFKPHIRFGPADEIRPGFLKEMWRYLLAGREARIKLMTDGRPDRKYASPTRH